MCNRSHLPFKIFNFLAFYHEWGNFRWAKLLQYPQYMDFRGNTFAVKGQGTLMLVAKDTCIGKIFTHASLKNHKNHKS